MEISVAKISVRNKDLLPAPASCYICFEYRENLKANNKYNSLKQRNRDHGIAFLC